jgi:hypothetical protein
VKVIDVIFLYGAAQATTNKNICEQWWFIDLVEDARDDDGPQTISRFAGIRVLGMKMHW